MKRANNASNAKGAYSARHASADTLAQMLTDTRLRTLLLADALAAALGDALIVPQRPHLNPPLWELGHLAWFADHWLFPTVQRIPHYDALYDSSHVPHHSRWGLPLPNLEQTKDLLAASLQAVLQKLSKETSGSDEALYFYRLALFHEDMHAEAAVFAAHDLGISIPQILLRLPCQVGAPTTSSLCVPAGMCRLGSAQGDGFVFDNELGQHAVPVSAFEIDARAVTWAQYVPFLRATGRAMPKQLDTLNLNEAAVHVSLDEAQAWCVWAGRRLPTELEWEYAVCTIDGFLWGEVWEWTASTLEPYPGFVPHAYKDYSEPWFGTHQVLRGASVATSERMVHPKYRNFFKPDRTDMFAGFRSAAL